jgi:hypothetical protein
MGFYLFALFQQTQLLLDLEACLFAGAPQAL